MQLFLEGETLEDSGVVSWVDVQGFPGHLLDAWECTGTGCATGWVDRTHGSCTVDCLLLSKVLLGWVLQARPREGDRRLLNLQSPEGIKRPESRQGMLAKNERAGRDSRQPG